MPPVRSGYRTTPALAVVVLCLALGACGGTSSPPPPPSSSASPATPAGTPPPPPEAPPTQRIALTPAEAQAFATMDARLKEYVDLHRKIEASLPRLPDAATPAQIDKYQSAFEVQLLKARAGAKPGDIFTPEATVVIKRLLAGIFGGPDGQQLKASINDENPVDPAVKLTVNGRYLVPLTTVPPQVLQLLPRLTEDLEYRFIGDSIILLDTHAHVIADFIDHALPK